MLVQARGPALRLWAGRAGSIFQGRLGHIDGAPESSSDMKKKGVGVIPGLSWAPGEGSSSPKGAWEEGQGWGRGAAGAGRVGLRCLSVWCPVTSGWGERRRVGLGRVPGL